MTSQELVIKDEILGATDRLGHWKIAIKGASADELSEIAAYSEAVGIAARARSSESLLRQAAEVRMRSLKRLAELCESADESEAERIWDMFPPGLRGKSSLPELAAIPKSRFEKALEHQLENGDCWGLYSIIRRARLQSLRHVEQDVKQAWDGTYFARRAQGWTRCSSLEDARHQAGLRSDPGTRQIEALYGRARVLSQSIAQHASPHHPYVKPKTKERLRLLQEAELLQMKVAELLHQAILER